MCKACGYEPYLAGKVVVFQAPPRFEVITEIDDRGYERRRRVEIDDRLQATFGRCVRHHKGWITVRFTGGREQKMRADDVLAYALDE